MADRYWVGGTGLWDSNVGTKWATTSGGAGGASIPTLTDNVFFDAASGAVTVTVSSAECANLNFTGFTGSIDGQTNAILYVFGDLILSATMGSFGSALANCSLIGSTSTTVTTNGKQSSWAGSFGGLLFSGSSTKVVTLLDDLKVQKAILRNNTVLTLNNFSLDLISGSNGLSIECGSTIGPTLNFGTTGKIIVRSGGSPVQLITSSGGFDKVTFTGSKLVSVDVPSATTISQSASIGSGLANQALTYVSTAANQATFRVYTAEDVDWTLGTGGLEIAQTDNYIYGNWNSGTKVVNKLPPTNCNVYFRASSGTKTISGTGTWFGITLILQPQTAAVTYNLGSNITQNNNQRSTFSWSSAGVGATFNTNNYTIITSGFSSDGGTCNLGTSSINSYAFNFGFPSSYLVSFGSGTDASNATVRAILNNGRLLASNMTIGTLSIQSFLTVTIPTTSVNLTFGTITNTVNGTTVGITFPSGVTTTVNNFNFNGVAGIVQPVRSTTAGSRAFISKASGTVNVNYLDIRDSGATGGATWNALLTNGNVDSGNNSGWDFGVVNVTGVAAAGQVGTVLVDVGDVAVSVTGVSASGGVGTVTVDVPTDVNVVGVQATGNVGVVAVTITNDVDVVGVQATGEVGNVTVVAEQNINVSLIGVSASGDVGVPTVIGSDDIVLVGVQATGEVGSVTVVAVENINVNLIGVSANGQVGNLFFYQWSTIIDTQDPSWVPVNDLQTPTWATINPNNTPAWTNVIT